MAFPTYTYVFTNGSTADATQVNQNYTDILNGITDTTKDISINALTVAGAATLNGNVTLGNSSAKLITFTGSLNSSIPVGTTFTYDIGAATVGLRDIYFGSSDLAARTTKIRAGVVASSNTLTLPIIAGTLAVGVAPTVQTFTTGSGTYTTPANCKWVRVRAVGPGGGGAGNGSTGTSGAGGASANDTTFGTSLIVAGKGSGGAIDGGAGGAGGTASLGSGPIGTAIAGAKGGSGGFTSTAIYMLGGAGGSSPLGGAGNSPPANTAGNAAIANSGSGGSGSSSTGGGDSGGSGGGAGGYVDAIITSPLATYAYTVGAGGAAGTAGTGGKIGGAGGSGYIEVTEYYF